MCVRNFRVRKDGIGARMARCETNIHSLSDARPGFTALNTTVNTKSLAVVIEMVTLLLNSSREFTSGKPIYRKKKSSSLS